MGLAIGIDLGVHYSTVAFLDGSRPNVLENRENRTRTRSVVSLKKRKGSAEPEILVGDAALDNWAVAPKDTIIAVRRLLGRSFSDPEVQKVRRHYMYEVVQGGAGAEDTVRVKMGGKEYSPTDIAALILKKLKADAEFRLGKPVTHAAITVPPYFSARQREETREAGLKAGLQATIVDEPVAAAVAFGMDADPGASARTVLVYDLGSSSFDTAILAVSGDVFSPLTLAGDLWLGAETFDQALVNRVLAQVQREHGVVPSATDPKHARFMARLRKAAEETRERLCAARSADLVVAGQLQDSAGEVVDVQTEITRDEFEALVRPLVEHSVKLVMKALDHAKLETHEIDLVLLAGEATRVPLVRQAVEDVFGATKVRRTIVPDHCVALGAALLAARLSGAGQAQAARAADGTAARGAPARKAVEPAGAVAPTNYGARLEADTFTVLIAKGDPCPTPREKRAPLACLTRLTGQRALSVPLYGGEDLEHAGATEKQGEVFALLPPGLPAGTRVYITLGLNKDGVFEVGAALEDGATLEPWIMRGELDQRAAEAVGAAERRLAERSRALPSKERKRIEAGISRAYEELKKGSFNEALRLAAACEAALPQPVAAPQEPVAHARGSEEAEARTAGQAGSGTPPEQAGSATPAVDPEQLKRKAGNLISYVEVALKDYGWTFPLRQESQLSALVAETRSAMQAGDAGQLGQKVAALDKASDLLPPVVRRAIGLRVAILVRVKPGDPGLGDELLRELGELEKAFGASGTKLLVEFGAKLAEALKAVEKDDAPAGQRCAACGAELKGERYCLSCYDERWSSAL